MIEAAFVGLDGSIVRQPIASGDTVIGFPQIATMLDGDVAVLWQHDSTTSQRRIVSLSAGGTVHDLITFDDAKRSGAQLISNGSRLSFLTAKPWFDAPHHGATRVLLRNAPFAVAGPPIGAPPAPHATARLQGTHMVVEWTGSGATGCRIEYRVGDGSWNEVAGWFDGQTRSASLTMPDNTAFRVRAYNDFGMSVPSAATPAIRLNRPKRRAAR